MARRSGGELEHEILTILWSADAPLIPSEVLSRHGSGLAYTTVMTILSRLWEKGLVERSHRGRAFQYSPAVTEAEFGAAQLADALARLTDRSAALSSFVQRLSASDARQLRAALDGRKKRV